MAGVPEDYAAYASSGGFFYLLPSYLKMNEAATAAAVEALSLVNSNEAGRSRSQAALLPTHIPGQSYANGISTIPLHQNGSITHRTGQGVSVTYQQQVANIPIAHQANNGVTLAHHSNKINTSARQAPVHLQYQQQLSKPQSSHSSVGGVPVIPHKYAQPKQQQYTIYNTDQLQHQAQLQQYPQDLRHFQTNQNSAKVQQVPHQQQQQQQFTSTVANKEQQQLQQTVVEGDSNNSMNIMQAAAVAAAAAGAQNYYQLDPRVMTLQQAQQLQHQQQQHRQQQSHPAQSTHQVQQQQHQLQLQQAQHQLQQAQQQQQQAQQLQQQIQQRQQQLQQQEQQQQQQQRQQQLHQQQQQQQLSQPNPPAGNNPNEKADERPIGYGAFGVVWSVTDPRSSQKVALKKMPNVFQTLVSSKRVFRELRMLTFFKHENVLSALDIVRPPPTVEAFHEIYVMTELMQSDLHKIIVSPQTLSADHIKVFLYQILRGLKYLHSARIIHRDIKPGNLLVNSNCILKICDFGLARVVAPDDSRDMTQEVVTQYYRGPELLMGAKYYTQAIDIWSVGCVFGELLGRRILFQATTPLVQLERITDLLGTPSATDVRYAAESARNHVLKRPHKPSNVNSLYSLGGNGVATQEAVHLLTNMLRINYETRYNVLMCLDHPYLDEGRLRYHSCMCSCCGPDAPPPPPPVQQDFHSWEDGLKNCPGFRGANNNNLEPVAEKPFQHTVEDDLRSLSEVKERMHRFICTQMSGDKVPLCINPNSAAYKSFSSSTVAHPSEFPPSPHNWD